MHCSIRLPPRYQPIWTIYIPFESPWIIDFRNAWFDLNSWCYSMPWGATLCKLVFSGDIAACGQRHIRKTIWLKILPNLLFYQFISKLFASPCSTLCHLWMTQRSWENLDCIKFRSTFAVSIEVSKFSEAKSFSGICCNVVGDHTHKFQFFWHFLLILEHVLMRYVWNHCHQAADMVQIEPPSWHYHIDLGFAIHEAAPLKHEAIQ